MSRSFPLVRCSRIGVTYVVAAFVLSACSRASSLGFIPTVSYDTPSLRALKAAAHIQTCPRTAAAPRGSLRDVTLPCLGGGPAVRLASLRGPLLINVWEAGCAPCRDEAPYLSAFARKYAGRVAVLGVDYQDWEPSAAIGAARTWGLTFPMIADLNRAIRTISTPTTILLDENGRITFQQPIAFTSEEQLERLVQAHLGVARG